MPASGALREDMSGEDPAAAPALAESGGHGNPAWLHARIVRRPADEGAPWIALRPIGCERSILLFQLWIFRKVASAFRSDSLEARGCPRRLIVLAGERAHRGGDL